MNPDPKNIVAFQEIIFSWWGKNKRDLPWRHTRDPYRILVSEMMLQQTQVSRVVPKYTEFLNRFPDVFVLSASPASEVIRIWKGMGYNRRALYLKRTAEAVVSQYGGIFPSDEEQLKRLPGIGPYTARAVMVFAFEKDVAMVDTNVRRLITGYFFGGEKQPEQLVLDMADALVPHGKSWEWHQALMDYGALVSDPPWGKPTHRSARSRIPFAQTDRFIRGKIMDEIRISDRSTAYLEEKSVSEWGRDPGECGCIIDGLVRDGLLILEGDSVRLPD